MNSKDNELKKGLTPEEREEVSEFGELMHNFYHFKPEDRNRIIDGIHSMNISIDEAKE